MKHVRIEFIRWWDVLDFDLNLVGDYKGIDGYDD